MKLYAIRDWDEIYENNRSRAIKDLRWVSIPNHHDGENFSEIMAHPDGSKIFSAFILMVQVASRCDPRGTLLKGDNTPHNVRSLSVRCRAPAEWFQIAIDYLEAHTDWLVITEFTKERQETAVGTSGQRHPPDEGGREGRDGKEGRDTPLSVSTNHPPLANVIAWFTESNAGYSADEIRRAFNSFEAATLEGQWMFGKRPVTNWQIAMGTRLEDQRQRNPKKNSKPTFVP